MDQLRNMIRTTKEEVRVGGAAVHGAVGPRRHVQLRERDPTSWSSRHPSSGAYAAAAAASLASPAGPLGIRRILGVDGREPHPAASRINWSLKGSAYAVTAVTGKMQRDAAVTCFASHGAARLGR